MPQRRDHYRHATPERLGIREVGTGLVVEIHGHRSLAIHDTQRTVVDHPQRGRVTVERQQGHALVRWTPGKDARDAGNGADITVLRGRRAGVEYRADQLHGPIALSPSGPVRGRRSDEHDEHAIGRAQALDPTSLMINTDLGFVLYYSRQYDAAIQQLQMVTEMNADFALAHFWLGRAYQEKRRYDDAIAEFRRIEAALHGWPVVSAAIGHVHGVSGRTREALETLDGLEHLRKERYVTPYGVALVHAGLGDKDEALAWLSRALVDRSHWLVWLKLDPRLDALRSDRRYADLLLAVGLQ